MKKTLWMTAALALVACAPTQVGSRYVKTQVVDAVTGGTVAVAASESAGLAGTALDVPAGALSSSTLITLEPGLEPLVTNGEFVSPVVTWGPVGVTFSSPATLRLPVSLQPADQAEELEAVQADANGDVTTFTVTLDPTRTVASFKVPRLASFQVWRRGAQCGASRTCPAGTVCAVTASSPVRVCRPQEADGGVRTCSSDSDCGAAQVCLNGVCEFRCASTPVGCGGGTPSTDGGVQCASNSRCPSTQVCVNGWCQPLCVPQVEVCDGIDNDCDGVVDDGCHGESGGDGGTSGGGSDGGRSGGGYDGGRSGGGYDGGTWGGGDDGGTVVYVDAGRRP